MIQALNGSSNEFLVHCFQDASSIDLPHRRILRRETAIELPITPSKGASLSINVESTFLTETEPPAGTVGATGDAVNFNRNLSAEIPSMRQSSPANLLVQSLSEPPPRPFKKSNESLQKNSSSDTEYSAQPYKVIKQSSNETNSS